MRTSKIFATTLFAVLALMLTARPAHATFPGENGKIVFIGNQSGSLQLYTINPDGSDLDQITHFPSTSSSAFGGAVFSPDGRRIAFSYGTLPTNGNPQVEIYVMKADGTDLKQLTDDKSFDQLPNWSPDGTRIVFDRTFVPTNETLIAVMRADDGGDKKDLTTGDWDFWASWGPVYTPDGRHIVFSSQFGGLVSAAWIMNADASDRDRLTPAPLEAAATDVSPVGTQILLSNHNLTSAPNAIYVSDLSGKSLRELIHPPDGFSDIPLSYSPDGKKILFGRAEASADAGGNNYDLFTMNADGTDITRITTVTTGLNQGSASWGPKPSK